ncbi:hypothetical protein [Pseudomonas sp. CLCA07]
MQAGFDLEVGLGIMSWFCASGIVTTLLLVFPILQFSGYLGLWPIGISVLVTIILGATSIFARRDHKVSISIVPEGLIFRDEAVGFHRQDLILNEEIRSVRVRRNPFFKTLIIDLKETNQRFSLSNVMLPDDFLSQIQARIGGEN